MKVVVQSASRSQLAFALEFAKRTPQPLNDAHGVKRARVHVVACVSLRHAAGGHTMELCVCRECHFCVWHGKKLIAIHVPGLGFF